MIFVLDHSTGELSRLARLRREWAACVLLAALFLLAGAMLVGRELGAGAAVRWLIVSGGLAVYLFAGLFRHLDENRRPAGSSVEAAPAELLTGFGPANRITIVRAVMTAALAGFLIVPQPAGWLGWAPGILYLAAALMDYLDGYVARVTRRTTLLGERLDMQWDGAGVAIGSVLLVLYGQAPAPYLLVGLARYLFVLGGWLRRRAGQPVYHLPPGRFRRALAGSQMGFIAATLLPVFTPPATHVAALLFMLPFLSSFLRDWLAVSGQLRPVPEAGRSALRARLETAFPLVMRAALLALLAGLLVEQFNNAAPPLGIALVVVLAIPALLLGAAGRAAAGALMLAAGFALQAAPLDGRYWVLLIYSTVLFMTGTGRLSLWKPEEWIIYHRAGE